MTVSCVQPADAAVPGRRRARIRLVAMGVSTGAVLASGVSIAGPASAHAVGNKVPVVGYGHMCLDDQGASRANFNPVQVCNNSAAQQRTKVAADHTIQALGKCLDVQYGGTADCTGNANQSWDAAWQWSEFPQNPALSDT